MSEDPVRMFVHAIYGVVESFTGIVGLTPVQALAVVAAFFVVVWLYAVGKARFGGDPFSFDEVGTGGGTRAMEARRRRRAGKQGRIRGRRR